MPLFLVETATNTSEPSQVEQLTATIDRAVPGGYVEGRVTADLKRLFAVVEADDARAVVSALDGADVAVEDIAQVRLVGAEFDEVKASAGATAGVGPRYLVEWDLPENLDMDTYLARKKEKSPLYAQVPEVAFRRTYVREDMGKCLCFYDAGCEADVRRAREVVSTPVDRLHELA